MTRYGGECYAVTMLAAGHIDLNFEPEVEPMMWSRLYP